MAVFLIKEPRCIFIHIPKTGGSSIRSGFFQDNVEGPKQGFIPPNWQQLFKFAFVRNPYDRVVSAWKMFAGGMEQTAWQHPQDAAGIDLQEFMKIVTDESIPFDGIRDSTPRKIRHHCIAQMHPFNCLHDADFVGRFENLQADFKTVCQTVGIENSDLPHWNRTDRSADIKSHFDTASLQMVNEFYAEDFKQLNYPVLNSINEF